MKVGQPQVFDFKNLIFSNIQPDFARYERNWESAFGEWRGNLEIFLRPQTKDASNNAPVVRILRFLVVDAQNYSSDLKVQTKGIAQRSVNVVMLGPISAPAACFQCALAHRFTADRFLPAQDTVGELGLKANPQQTGYVRV